jgi:tol-pal system protein YbgF
LRTRWIVLGMIVLFLGALGGAALAPPPAGAVSREIIQLQQQVSQLMQGQQDLRSAVDSNNAALRTLVQQSLDSINQLNTQMGSLQKTVQEVQANTGSRMDTMGTQTQGLSDNLQDVQARVGKLSQQLTDVQNLLQSIDAKVSGGTTAAAGASGLSGPGAPGGPTASGSGTALPPISSETLYQNGLRDFTSGKYDLSRQEFADYLKNFPGSELASNAQFYLGELAYAQGKYQDAIAAYQLVLANYPKSFKLAAALLKKAMAELELGMKLSGTRDLREVIQRFPGSDESRRAQAKLKEMGLSTRAPR